MKIFGDKDTFAISYKHNSERENEYQILIHCHLILKDVLIGDTDEVDLLGTCIGDLIRLKSKVLKNQGHLRIPLFDELNNDEIFELIYKSNQLKGEYNPNYLHLPALKRNDLWSKHTVTLAESTDPYSIVVFEENGSLKFLWQKWKEREGGNKDLYSVYVDHKVFYSAIDDFLVFLKHTYAKNLDWFNL